MAGNDSVGQLLIMLVIVIVVFIILGFIVKITWNYTLPRLTNNVGEIDLYQSIALIILVGILFGNRCYYDAGSVGYGSM